MPRRKHIKPTNRSQHRRLPVRSSSATNIATHSATKLMATKPIVAGLVYADWCGHCTHLKPTWDRMAASLPPSVEIHKINSNDQDAKIAEIERTHGLKMAGVNQYPYVFRIVNKTLSEYNGDRTEAALKIWILGGADPAQTAQAVAVAGPSSVGPNIGTTSSSGGKRYSRKRIGCKRIGCKRYSRSVKGGCGCDRSRTGKGQTMLGKFLSKILG